MENFIPPSSAKEHERYLREQVERYSQVIKTIEDEIRRLESQKIEAQSSLVYFGKMLEFIKGQAPSLNTETKQPELASIPNESLQLLRQNFETVAQSDALSGEPELNPLNMLKAEFQNKSMEEVVLRCLELAGGKGTALALAKLAYDTPDEKNFQRARNSISSALRDGAIAGKGWRKIGRGEFALDSFFNQNANDHGGHSMDIGSLSGLIAAEHSKDPQGIP